MALPRLSMAIETESLAALAATTNWSYAPQQPSSAEPAAWTALALIEQDELELALRPAQWLASIQQATGAVGMSIEQPRPRWPTSLAILVWQAIDAHPSGGPRFERSIEQAVAYALQTAGNTGPRKPQVGHDTTIPGWSWAENTHSWMEPTCYFVQALRAAGFRDHQRVRQGVRMIVDRLLPIGGCNYGNTFALGQMLLPHVQPTGIALQTLAPEPVGDPRIEKSLEYLVGAVNQDTPAVSLAHALIGLAAHGRCPAEAEAWIEHQWNMLRPEVAAPYRQALLCLALAHVRRASSNEANQ